MKNSEAHSQKRHGVRPAYITLGVDTEGESHVYHTFDESVQVGPNAERVETFDLDDKTVDDYVRFVRDDVDHREWTTRNYIADDESPFAAMVEQLADAMGAAV